MLTVERLIAIRKPLHAHLFWRKYKPGCIIAIICCVSFLFQIYNFFYITPMTLPNCMDNSKRVHFFMKIKIVDNYYLFYFVQYSLMVIPLITITLPVVLLALFNCLLLYYLRSSRKELGNFVIKTNPRTSQNEWKVTITVLAIVFTLLIFNIPSVVYYWLSTFSIYNSVTLSFLSNFAIVVSKTVNFLLYCLTSSKFRLRLLKIFASKAKIRCMYRRNSEGTVKLLTNRQSKKLYNSLPLAQYNDCGRNNYVHSSDIIL